MPPTATIVEALDPVMAPNSTHVMTTVMPRPPGRCPTRCWMKLMRRADSPPRPMILAARMKKGIANNGKLSSPANTRCESIDSGIGVVRAKTMKVVPVSTMNIGMVRKRPSARSPKINAMVVPPPPEPMRLPSSVLQIHGKRRARAGVAEEPPQQLADAQEHQRAAGRHGEVGEPHRRLHDGRHLAAGAHA